MTDLYTLPEAAVLGGKTYPHRTAWQDMLKLLQVLGNEDRPAFLRWYTALSYFYRKPIPEKLAAEAAAYLSDFLTCGQEAAPGPKLMDWQQDAGAIMADINAVAGREVRSEQAHWWTFLGWFHSIRQGQLSNLVSIRDKLRRGKKLEDWEQEFYRANRNQVLLQSRESPEDKAAKQRLNALLQSHCAPPTTSTAPPLTP